MRDGFWLGFGFAAMLAVPLQAQDTASLAGTYEAIQRIPASQLQAMGLGPGGRDRMGVPGWADPGAGLGAVGVPMTGTLVLAANGTFTLSLASFDEGSWRIMTDKNTHQPFLRFQGRQMSFDAILSGYGLGPNEIGIWRQYQGEWNLLQFRRSAATGVTADPYSASEAELNSLFGQGKVVVDFAEVAKGSATGVRVAGGKFSQGVRFSSTAEGSAPTLSGDRVVLIFLPDGRFTIHSTLSGRASNGTYQAEGSTLVLRLDDGTEEVWEIGREQITGRFAIRPARSGGSWFFELPFSTER